MTKKKYKSLDDGPPLMAFNDGKAVLFCLLVCFVGAAFLIILFGSILNLVIA
jgi:hypothetical protein